MALLALTAAGCGGQTSSGSSDATPATHDAFVKEATALCRANRARFVLEVQQVVEEQSSSTGESAEDAQAAAVRTYLVPAIRQQNDELRALGIPLEDEEQVLAIVDAMERVIDEAEQHPARFLYRQSHFKHPFAQAHDLAEAYGIPACARV